ncbi:MAG: hypothetical protein ACLR6J_14140 [Parabacteroides merdae]
MRLLLVGPFEKELDPVLPEVEEHILHHPGTLWWGTKRCSSFLSG